MGNNVRTLARRPICVNKVPDPEDVRDPVTGRREVGNFTNFMKLLAQVARAPRTAESDRGALLFAAIGCVACRVPARATGPSSNPVFDRKVVAPFSDLLLHDIGYRAGRGAPERDPRSADVGPAVPQAAAPQRQIALAAGGNP